MSIWELRNDRVNEFAVLVHDDSTALDFGMFEIDGRPKHWLYPPKVKPFLEKRRKTQKPLADISYLTPGAVVLGPVAYVALKDFLLPFGQLLPLECAGREGYFYNVTNLLECVDVVNSQLSGGVIVKERFFPDVVPDIAQIFKDPNTARVRIYINQPGRDQLTELLDEFLLSGIAFAEPGAPVF